jgi:hypothetical protein
MIHMKTDPSIQKLMGGGGDSLTHKQHGDTISLLSFEE